MTSIEQPEFEKRFKEIKTGIEGLRRKGSSITREQLFRDSEREDILSEKLLGGHTPEEEDEYRMLKVKIENSGLIVKTLPEFRYALECLGIYSPEEIKDILSHENAHANKMESLGILCLGYEIIVFKKENGKGGLMFITIADAPPADWDKNKKLEVHKKIANAPEEYESNHPLSSFDRATIHRLTNNEENS